MISVIVGTNRANSRSQLVAEYYQKRLKELAEEDIQLLNLSEISQPFLTDNRYKAESQSSQLTEIQDRYFINAEKWIVLLDAMSIREYQNTFLNKKIALVGISAGKAGNLRGLDYLANLLSYVKADVFRNRLPISQIENLVEDDQLHDQPTKEAIDNQLKEFIAHK